MRELVKEKAPLVINITNKVTINDIANILSTIGASPIMTNDPREIEDLFNIAAQINSAVVLNIGTLNQEQIELMYKAAEIANEKELK